MNEVTIEDKNVINLKLIECLLVLNLSIFENKSKYRYNKTYWNNFSLTVPL